MAESIDLELSTYTDQELRELLSVTLAQVEHWNKLFNNSDKLKRHREGDRIAFEMLFEQCKKDVVAIEQAIRQRTGQKVKVVKGSGRKSPELPQQDGSLPHQNAIHDTASQ
jgi:hypothetical protein